MRKSLAITLLQVLVLLLLFVLNLLLGTVRIPVGSVCAILLGSGGDGLCTVCADVNGDTKLSIEDVTALIGILLSGN